MMDAVPVADEVIPDPQAAADPIGKPRTLDDVLDDRIFVALNVTARGLWDLLHSTVRGVPYDRFLIGLCRNAGKIVSLGTCVGDIAPKLTLRIACKEAFNEGVGSAPIRPAPTPPSGSPVQFRPK